jgi:hypothetical protein
MTHRLVDRADEAVVHHCLLKSQLVGSHHLVFLKQLIGLVLGCHPVWVEQALGKLLFLVQLELLPLLLLHAGAL